MSLLLWWLLGSVLIGGCLYITISGLINRSRIREHLDHEEKSKGKSLYGLITDVQPNTVSLTMLDRYGDKEEDVQYESSDGVSSFIREGDRI